MSERRTIRILTREAGLALAVLALWMLALLAPLHQTSGMLRAFDAAGIELASSWSICVADAEVKTDHAIPSCPAQGIGKQDLLTPPGPTVLAVLAGPVVQVMTPVTGPPPRAEPELGPQQARAPPFHG